MPGIELKEVGVCGVVVLAQGACSRQWYVAWNGQILHRSHDYYRAGSLYSDFTICAHVGDKYGLGPGTPPHN